MASTTATLTPSPAVVPTATALTLANVLYEKKGAIAYVTVNRPKVLNALNTPTWKDLRTAFEDARDDTAVRGVILTGAGNKAFIAGADIGELAHVAAFEAEQSSRFGQEVLDLIENLGKPWSRRSTALRSAAAARRRWLAPSGSRWRVPNSASRR